ncbi:MULTISPECIES: hypothetical protein [Novacetimonas]|uniref:Uncharacterized protein n=1 Tax=Novacetimonas hansenii TaxID=436 RepID=A0AAW5EMQ3_NOVHA|nr:hypothetical protein [Novacetimonas hansenii]MCJ8353042.1 hypothetical protein [Novacetimonas hansenii]WEQ58387.1 hypothetical protein LV563_11060 [Novacetimonas hansenii]
MTSAHGAPPPSPTAPTLQTWMARSWAWRLAWMGVPIGLLWVAIAWAARLP